MCSKGKKNSFISSVMVLLAVCILSFSASAEHVFSEWEELSDLNFPRSRPALAAVGNDVYMIGGETTGGTRLDSIEKYNSVTDEWELLTAEKPIAVSNIAVASIGTKIYVPGGWIGSASIDSLEVFDTATETWQVIDTDPLPNESSAHGVVAHDGKIYVVGGYASSGYLDHFMEYDPAAPEGSRWTILSSLNVERGYLNAVAFNGHIYAIGGRNAVGLNSIEEYDFATDTWTLTDTLPFSDGGGVNAAVLPGPGYLESDYIIIAGGGWSIYRNECYAYNPATGEFLDYAPLNTARRTFGMAATNNAFFVAGGWNGQYLASAEKIECVSLVGEWIEIANLNNAISRPAMAAVGDNAYLIGGEMSGSFRPKTTEKYIMATNEWELLTAEKPTAVSNIAAASIGTKIYVPGGWTGSVAIDSMEVFDTVTETWSISELDPMPSPSFAHGVAAYDGKIYVVGGSTGSNVYVNHFFEYDPEAPAGSRWTTLSPMNTERGYLGVVAFNDKIYAIGGRAAAGLNSIEEYDFATDTWTVTHTLPFTDGSGVNAAVLQSPGYFESNYIIIAGGGWSSYRDECYAYNPATGQFLEYAPLNNARRTFGMAATSNAFFVAAGWSGVFMDSAEMIWCTEMEEICINNGDVNQDGILSAADAQLAFYIALGQYSPTYEEECAADCNGDGIVTAADAQLIFYTVIGIGDCADPL